MAVSTHFEFGIFNADGERLMSGHLGHGLQRPALDGIDRLATAEDVALVRERIESSIDGGEFLRSLEDHSPYLVAYAPELWELVRESKESPATVPAQDVEH